MATKVTMEALSPTMEEGRLVKWTKNEGDTVKSGEVLAEVETDKAIMELVARADGVLRKRLAAEGTSAPVGTLLAVIGSADENIDALVAGAAPAAAAAAPAKAAAPAAAQGGAPAGRAPAPPPPRAPAPTAVAPRPAPSAPAAAPAAAPSNGGGRIPSSPLARRLAAERGLDLGRISGSGPNGRIIRRDIEAAEQVTQPAGMAFGQAGPDYEDVPLTQIRKTIARRLAESIGPVPTFYLTSELALDRVAEMRSAMAEAGPEFKVSFNDIILKAVATALREHPECNAHWLGDHIRYFNRVHLGMAVATDDGLIVPVIFDAHLKPLRVIAAEARDLAGRARERKLTPEQYTGSTFSVSNLGMLGIDQFTAIINPPECAILAIGAIEDKPIVQDGEISVHKRLRVTMSCDHRVIDGAVGARFLQTLRRLVENPLMLVY